VTSRRGRTIGFRTYGKSKTPARLPQIVIGMAVTRDGIPVRVWSWPGTPATRKLIPQVKTDMRELDPDPHRLGR